MVPSQSHHARLPLLEPLGRDQSMTDYLHYVDKQLSRLSCDDLGALCRELNCGVDQLSCVVAARTNALDVEEVAERIEVEASQAADEELF